MASYYKYINRLGLDGLLARRGMEFYNMGLILRYNIADRKELFEVIYKSADEDMEESSSKEEPKSVIYESIEFSGEMRLNGNAAESARGSYYVIGEDNITVGGKLLVHTKSCEFTITVTDISQDFS